MTYSDFTLDNLRKTFGVAIKQKRLFETVEPLEATETIFGYVTTGEIWQYLKLEDSIIYIDSVRYYIDNVGQILGVLQKIIDFYQK